MSYVANWWMTEYAEDIFKYLMWKETNSIVFRGRSPQWEERGVLVDMLRGCGEALRLGNTSVHLAVRLLDLFLDNHRVEPGHLSLVALGCLLLAAKFEDREGNVPSVAQLQTFIPFKYPPRDLLAIENIILDFFNWNVAHVTVAHFAELLAMRVLGAGEVERCLEAADGADNAGSSHERRLEAGSLRTELLRLIHHFMDAALQEDVFVRRYRPSQVACACVLAARAKLDVWPPWPADMVRLTGYTGSQLITCAIALLRDLRACEPSSPSPPPAQDYTPESPEVTPPKRRRLNLP